MNFAKSLPWVLTTVVCVGIGFYVSRASVKTSVEQTLVDKVIDSLTDETAQTRFMSYATTISPLRRLELAKIHQLEMFERTSQMRVFWAKLNLPEVVVRATVPVEYRYYVDLNEHWKVRLQAETLTIQVPELLPGSPSPDISRLKFEVQKGSLFRNEKKVAQDLQAEITGLLNMRAKQSAPLVRETARKEIVSLAKQWLDFEGKHARITVQFADEASSVP